MTGSEYAELEAVIRKLRAVIYELEDLSAGIRADFTGIGNEYCAQAVDAAADKCRTVKRRLENLDTGDVTWGGAGGAG